MPKRSIYTEITPLPPNIPRELVIAMLHDHTEMIELNPLVIEHHQIKPPKDAPADEFHCVWHSMTDRISYFPGVKGKITYRGCFFDLPYGLQTHCYAPMGVDIRDKWSVGGNLPGEDREVRELGLNTPRDGLYLREDVDMRCSSVLTAFVRKNLDGAHAVLVERMIRKAEILDDNALAALRSNKSERRQFSQYSAPAGSQQRPHEAPGNTSYHHDQKHQHLFDPAVRQTVYDVPAYQKQTLNQQNSPIEGRSDAQWPDSHDPTRSNLSPVLISPHKFAAELPDSYVPIGSLSPHLSTQNSHRNSNVSELHGHNSTSLVGEMSSPRKAEGSLDSASVYSEVSSVPPPLRLSARLPPTDTRMEANTSEMIERNRHPQHIT